MNDDGVSVIICCYNSTSRLPETLRHLSLQKFTKEIPWEILIIDNNSTDGLMDYLNIEKNKNYLNGINIRIFPETNPGLSHARVRGIFECRYECIVFCDDDNWLDDRYVENAHHLLSKFRHYGIIGGLGKPAPEIDVPSWFEKNQGYFAVGPQSPKTGVLEGGNPAVYGAGSVTRKSLLKFIHENGFEFLAEDRKGNSLSSGGDVELCFAIKLAGWEIAYHDNLTFQHFIPKERLTTQYLRKLNFQMGYCGAIHKPYEWIFAAEKSSLKKSWQWFFLTSLNIFLLNILNLNLAVKTPYTAYRWNLSNSAGRLVGILKSRNTIYKNYMKLLNSRLINK